MKKSDAKFDAKMKVLQQLRDMAQELMGQDMSAPADMKEVSVAAPDKEGLEKGLDLASAMMEEAPEGELEEDDEIAVEEDPNDIDRQIAELMAKKAALEKKV